MYVWTNAVGRQVMEMATMVKELTGGRGEESCCSVVEGGAREEEKIKKSRPKKINSAFLSYDDSIR